MPKDSDLLIERSKAFAITAHEAVGHRRKYTDEPYSVHLAAVAGMVKEAGGSAEMIAAAWLHDSVEDTATEISDLESEFGKDVASLVHQLTDVSQPEDGNRAARKALDRAHIAGASVDAKTIKLADLIDNSRSIEKHDPRFARVYMAEKRLLLEVLDEGDPGLLDVATAIVDQYFQRNCSE